MKQLTDDQITSLQQILDDMVDDPRCDNGRGEWTHFVIGVRNAINMAIDDRDGDIIIDYFADDNYEDFGALNIVNS